MIFADRAPAADPLAVYRPEEIYWVDEKNFQSPRFHSTLGNAEGKPVVAFKPGLYHLGYWVIPETVKHVHVAGGAYVYGAIEALPSHHQESGDPQAPPIYRSPFKLTGYGVLSGEKIPWHTDRHGQLCAVDTECFRQYISLVRVDSQDFQLHDITLVSSPYYTTHTPSHEDPRYQPTGQFTNFKILGGWTLNNDGVSIPGGKDSIVRDCFIHASDDNIKLYNSNSTVKNCVLWKVEGGAVLQIGKITGSD